MSFSVKKKDNDLAAVVSRASGLEGQLNKSEAALSTALSQNAALTAELADVKSQLAKVFSTRLYVVYLKGIWKCKGIHSLKFVVLMKDSSSVALRATKT